MLKFAAVNQETRRPVLGIGLSRENCERLLAGQPIHFDTVGLPGLPEIQVFIVAGDTEDSIAFDMLQQGAALDTIGGDDMVGGPVS